MYRIVVHHFKSIEYRNPKTQRNIQVCVDAKCKRRTVYTRVDIILNINGSILLYF